MARTQSRKVDVGEKRNRSRATRKIFRFHRPVFNFFWLIVQNFRGRFGFGLPGIAPPSLGGAARKSSLSSGMPDGTSLGVTTRNSTRQHPTRLSPPLYESYDPRPLVVRPSRQNTGRHPAVFCCVTFVPPRPGSRSCPKKKIIEKRGGWVTVCTALTGGCRLCVPTVHSKADVS